VPNNRIKPKACLAPLPNVKGGVSLIVPDVALVENDKSRRTIVLVYAPALDVGGLWAPQSTVFMSKRPEGGKTCSHSIELVSCEGHHWDQIIMIME